MKNITRILLLLVFVGCSERKDKLEKYFDNVKRVMLKSQSVILDETSCTLSYMFRMEYIDGLLILNEFPDPKYCMKIVNLEKGHVMPFGKKGRGPNEMQAQSCHFSTDLANHKLYVKDSKKYFIYSTDSLKNMSCIPDYSFPFLFEDTFFLESSFCSNKIIGTTYKKRFGVYDIDTKVCLKKIDYKSDPLVDQGYIFSHPKQHKAVFFQSKLPLMSIIDIMEEDLKVEDFEWIDDQGDENKNRLRVRNGFIDASVGSNFIYALYSGKKINKQSIETLTDAFLSKYIYVFDWKGNPVKVYELDQEVRSIALDEKNNVLYAASYQGNAPHIIKFQL